jgi:Sec-independent protein secretion pathway component TatC
MSKTKTKNSFSFLEHLGELRKRLLYSIAIILIFFILSWNFRVQIYDFLSIPITQFLKGKKLIYTSLTEPLMMYIKLSFIGALFTSSPFIFHQLWLFISPGLYSKEKKMVFPFVFMATSFFLLGAGLVGLVGSVEGRGSPIWTRRHPDRDLSRHPPPRLRFPGHSPVAPESRTGTRQHFGDTNQAR